MHKWVRSKKQKEELISHRGRNKRVRNRDKNKRKKNFNSRKTIELMKKSKNKRMKNFTECEPKENPMVFIKLEHTTMLRKS